MRLTLRTLLAHLDQTLEADDDAAIAAKLRESEFAASLVSRITHSMASDQINAPSPSSTSTADDANRIGEYLDSVLPAEQITEIERICLESDMHLAEVAACHQILTMVLGNKADVPPPLRNRIYTLNQQRGAADSSLAATNGNLAGTVHRATTATGTASGADAITKAMAAIPGPATLQIVGLPPVMPVGPDDSGVSDAPTRLREAHPGKSTANRDPLATPATRRINAAEASEIFGRPARVVPWLVGLALSAAFLFVVMEAFAPILKKRTESDNEMMSLTLNEPDATPQPMNADRIVVAPTDATLDSVLEREANEMPAIVEPDPAIKMPNEPLPAELASASKPVPDAALPELPKSSKSPQSEQSAMAATVIPKVENPTPAVNDPDATALPSPAGLTFLTSDGTLCLIKKPADAAYLLAKKDEAIPFGSEIVCPPLFRDRLTVIDKYSLTMIGPTKLRFAPAKEADLAFTLTCGRLLLSPLVTSPSVPAEGKEQDVAPENDARSLQINFGGKFHTLTLTQAESIAAIDVVYFRNPGTDPEDERSMMPMIEVLATQGTLDWKTEGSDPVTIAVGELVRWSPTIALTKTTVASIPVWIDPPKEAAGSIETSAREGLFGLVRGNESIDLALREATGFRRAEVGSLAAQTLVLLDRPDVYFGTDGILSDAKQKAFWPDHFNALVAAVDRGPASAAIVREAINQMDAAEETGIYRLLWLFSNPQLEAGSDHLLVTSLDSANMAVRVLASENLRRITGTTLFFKPENETTLRRSSDIKKWETRLRKADIRWPAAK